MEKNFEENSKKLCDLISPNIFKFNMGLKNINVKCDYDENPEIIYLPSRIEVIDMSDFDIDYLNSNRHKLYQVIKNSTATGQDLSITMGKNKHYLSSTASQSRFDSRGDISETQLNRLITDISFAEREVLGLGAKEVDKIKNPLFKSDQELKKEVDSALEDIISDLNTDGMTEYKKPKTITIPKYYVYIFAVLLILAISLSIYTLTKLA